MRKIAAVLLAFVLSFGIAGCGEQGQTVAGIVEEVTATTLSISTEQGVNLNFLMEGRSIILVGTMQPEKGCWVSLTYTGQIDGTDTSQAAVTKVEATALGSAEGAVTGFSADTLSILTDSGQALAFSTANAKILAGDGLAQDIRVKVIFKGTVENGDTKNAAVLRVEALEGGEKPEEELPEQSGSIVGTVRTISSHSIVLLDDAKHELTFNLGDDVEISDLDGIITDSRVEIFYDGKIDFSGSSKIKVIRIELLDSPASSEDTSSAASSAPSSSDASSAPEPTTSVEGVIYDASMSIVGIQLDSGVKYTFTKGDDTQVDSPSGLLIGTRVRITFRGKLTGTDTTHLTVLKIVETAPPPLPAAAIDGQVIDASMATITIRCADLRQLSFALGDGIEVSAPNGIRLGSQVQISYRGELSGSDTTGVTVLKVVETAPPAESSEAENPSASGSVTGTIRSVSASHISVTTDDHWDLDFKLGSAVTIDGLGDLSAGISVRVYFTGKIYPPDTASATVTKIEIL